MDETIRHEAKLEIPAALSAWLTSMNFDVKTFTGREWILLVALWTAFGPQPELTLEEKAEQAEKKAVLEKKLAELESRHEELITQREQHIRELGASEATLQQAQGKLRELGIETVGMSSDQLKIAAADLEAQLQTKIAEITSQVEQGEALVNEYMKPTD